ncbi:MAG: 50S ribosomal protein L6 [Methanomicrobiales archaeon]|nr:50S ribosomal protein L6 [Methanomicrobiales archaeon]
MAFEKKVDIPGNVTVTMDGTTLVVSGPKGTLKREMRYPQVSVDCDEETVLFATGSDRKRIVAMVGTYAAHTNNMFQGVTEGFEYRMKVVYSHFPIQLKVAGNRLEIINFLGEKEARYARILDGVSVKLGNDEVTVSGIDKDAVGSTAANIETATHIRKRDPRVFQDGIYVVEKV